MDADRRRDQRRGDRHPARRVAVRRALAARRGDHCRRRPAVRGVLFANPAALALFGAADLAGSRRILLSRLEPRRTASRRPRRSRSGRSAADRVPALLARTAAPAIALMCGWIGERLVARDADDAGRNSRRRPPRRRPSRGERPRRGAFSGASTPRSASAPSTLPWRRRSATMRRVWARRWRRSGPAQASIPTAFLPAPLRRAALLPRSQCAGASETKRRWRRCRARRNSIATAVSPAGGDSGFSPTGRRRADQAHGPARRRASQAGLRSNRRPSRSRPNP